MASAGSISLDVKLNTSDVKKQFTQLQKSIGAIKMNVNFNNSPMKQINNAVKNTNKSLKENLTLEKAIQSAISSENRKKQEQLKIDRELARAAQKRLARENDISNIGKSSNVTTPNINTQQVFKDFDMSKLQSGLNIANTITNTMASGSGSIVQGVTSIASTIGGLIGSAIGTPLTGAIVSTVISMLGNITQIVINTVKGIINIVIKIVKGGLSLISSAIKGIINLPNTIGNASKKVLELASNFKLLGGAINYAKDLISQFSSIISQKFSAYSIINFTKECFEMGSSLTEQSHILQTIIPKFMEYQDALGGTSEYLNYMKEVTSNLGISQVNATKYMAGFASMWQSMGGHTSQQIKTMSQDMLQLTSDLSSFKDLNFEDVSKSLKSVIFGGQTRTGLNLGVDIYVSTMKKYAQSVGLVWDNLSGAEKSALRLKKVMNDLSFMKNDFSNTAYTWANQVRFLKEQFTNLKSLVGENLIMAFNWVLTVINKVLSALNTLAAAINSFFKSIGLGWILQSKGNSLSGAIEDETGALEDAADGVGSAGSKAAKEIQRSLMPFDKLLNKLDKDTDSSSGGGGGGSTSAGDMSLSIDNPLEDLLNDSDNLITKSIERLKNSLKKVTKFFHTLWSDFVKYFAKPFGDFLQSENGIPRLINNIADLIDGIEWDKLNIVFAEWFKSLEPLAEFFWNVGCDIQEYFINPLIQFAMNKILPGIIESLTKLNNAVDWELVRTGIKAVIMQLEPLLETIMNIGLWLFQNILEPIGEWFLNSCFPAICALVSTAFKTLNTLFQALKPYWDEFYNDFLVPFGQIIGEKIITGIMNLTQWLSDLGDKLSDETWVENNFGFLSEDIQKLKDDLQNFDIVTIVSDLFTLLGDLIQKADETFGISTKFKEMLTNVINFVLDTVAPILVSKVKELWTTYIEPNLPGWFLKIWATLQIEFLKLSINMINYILNKINEFKIKMMAKIVLVAVELVVNFINKIKEKINDSSSEIQNKIKDAFNAFQLGKDIGSKIVDGLSNAFEAIKEKINSIKNSVKNAITSAGSTVTNNTNTSGKSSSSRAAFATGGYVYSRPGGVDVKVAEGGEGEYIFGDSMLRKAVREESGGKGTSMQPIILQLSDGTVLGQWMIDTLNSESYRMNGTKLI